MKKYNSIPIEHDLCLQNYTDEIIEEFQKIFNIDFSRKYLTLSEIKKNFLFYQKKIGQSTNQKRAIATAVAFCSF